MALTDFSDVNIRLDRANDRITEKIIAKEGDFDGRGLVVQVTNNGEIVDQTGLSLSLAWRHENTSGHGIEPFAEKDITNGTFEINYSSEFLQRGNVVCAIQIQDGSSITYSRNFNVTVEGSPLEMTQVESNDSFKTLNWLLVKAEDWDNRIDAVEQDFIDRANLMEQQYPARLTVVEDNEHETRLISTVLTQQDIQQSRDIEDFKAEIREIDLVNTDFYPFNNSAETIEIKKQRNTLNYQVNPEVISSDGEVGEVKITDKQLNGFKLQYTGSATSATIKYYIQGGMYQ